MKTLTIDQLAEKLNGNLWVKGDIKRIYLDYGWNTKKMSTKTYVFQRQDLSFGVSCTVNCPSQHDNWITKEQNEIIDDIHKRIAEIIEEYGFEIEYPNIAIQAALDAEEQVKGYYMRWHEVRVAINSYGKLATRKRMQVHTFDGPVSKTPAGFIALDDDDFEIALQKEKNETLYEYGCEPNLVGVAERMLERKAANEEKARIDEENKKIEAARQEKEKKQSAEELASKIQALKAQGFTSPLLAWKELGCPHPAPAEVVESKKASGLNWKDFSNTII